ncbi:prephenate dehydratase [Paraburkholderia ferrariae]|uniref:prephenate dehydratase n=1 Tax=Paraburkholderia ferrariae TaxID=386056 RepID=UPI000A02328F|nr:prephenate dehydratase [Paraburkholderia ferrariae]
MSAAAPLLSHAHDSRDGHGAAALVPAAPEAIEQRRTQIDAIDRRLLELIALRSQYALEIGQFKRSVGQQVYQPFREEAIIRVLCAQPHEPVRDQQIAEIWHTLFRVSRSLQQTHRVAFLGPQGTYTEEAMHRYFGTGLQAVARESIDSVFAALACGDAGRAVVPIENSTEGAVTQTVDCLVHAHARITGEIVLPVTHCLLTRDGALDGIECVAAHPQALAQCRLWLDAHMPGVRREAVASNAQAAQRVAGSTDCAAIAGEAAARHYGIAVAARAIQDRADNRTRFVVLGGPEPQATGHDRTSIVVELPNAVGALASVFEAFARHRVSILWLEPRPQHNGPWTYLFLIDVLGHSRDTNLAAALVQIGQSAARVALLGSYPCATNAAQVSSADSQEVSSDAPPQETETRTAPATPDGPDVRPDVHGSR